VTGLLTEINSGQKGALIVRVTIKVDDSKWHFWIILDRMFKFKRKEKVSWHNFALFPLFQFEIGLNTVKMLPLLENQLFIFLHSHLTVGFMTRMAILYSPWIMTGTTWRWEAPHLSLTTSSVCSTRRRKGDYRCLLTKTFVSTSALETSMLNISLLYLCLCSYVRMFYVSVNQRIVEML